MDYILPPDPSRPAVVYQVAGKDIAHSHGRSLVSAACAIFAVYLAFVVGAPWLLRDAPPDTYAVVAAKAACPSLAADMRALCATVAGRL